MLRFVSRRPRWARTVRIQYGVPQTTDPFVPVIASKPGSPARHCVTGIALFLVSLVLCVAGYLAFAAPGPWFEAPTTLRWGAGELSVTRGTAHLAPAGLVVSAPDAARTAVIALNTSFPARDYPVIAWDAADIPRHAQAILLWYSDVQASRVFRRPMVIEGDRFAPVSLQGDPGWLGRIRGLALVLQGDLPEPLILHGAEAKPMSAIEVLGDRAREWSGFEPWTGASINGRANRSAGQELPLPALLAAASALAGLAYAGLWRWRHRSPRRGFAATTPAIGLAAIFMAAWFVADGRWQWNLVRQAAMTWERYGGKSWEARHRSAEDGPLFDFIQRVRNKLPNVSARVFMAADLPYFRARGAYHLYPYNVYYDAASTAIPPPGVVRKGDYLVAYQCRGVQYDAAEHRLRWDGHAPVDAELLIGDAGAALFEIR